MVRLYIVGKTKRAEDTVNQLHDLFQGEWCDKYSLEVIDVMDNPGLAEQDRVIATPTLIKISPKPARRIIGDLNRSDMILHSLGLEKA